MSLQDLGWECPKCHTVYAPHVRSCDGCSQKAREQVADLKPEQIVSPLSALDEYSEEEILMWHSPYFDELQAKKELRQEQLRVGEDLNGNN